MESFKYKQNRLLKEKREKENLLEKNNLNIVLLVDGSFSVSHENFVTELSTCDSIARLTREAKFALVQFSNSVKEEISLVNSKEFTELIQSRNIQQEGGGTDLYKGLAQAKKILGGLRDEDTKVVLIITDGYPNKDPSQLCRAMELSGIRIICIGVGEDTNLTMCQSIASLGFGFHFKQFSTLKQGVGSLFKSAQLPFNAEVTLLDRPYSLDDRFWRFKTEIFGNDENELSKGSKIEFCSNGFFASKKVTLPEDATPNSSVSFEVSLRVPAEKTIDDFSEELNVVIETNEGRSLTIKKALRMDDIAGQFLNYKSRIGKTNILCFGVNGVGKTSTVKSGATLLNDSIVTNIQTGDGVTHTTTAIRSYDFSKILGRPVEFEFWDTWGLDLNNWDDSFFENLITGMVPDGFTMKDAESDEKGLQEPSPQTAMHAVLMFITHESLGSDAIMKRMHDFAQLCVAHDRKPILVVTKIDTAEEEDLESIATQIQEKIGLDSSHIFLHENYHEDNEKSFKIDKSSASILNEALWRADQYVAMNVDVEALRNANRPSEPLMTLFAQTNVSNDEYEVEVYEKTMDGLYQAIEECMDLKREMIRAVKRKRGDKYLKLMEANVRRLQDEGEILINLF